MPFRRMYRWRCTDCSADLTASCELNGQPQHVTCTCGRTFSGNEIETLEIEGKASMTTYQDGSPQLSEDLQSRNKRIKRPIPDDKLRRFKALEEAERKRVQRMDHEDDE